MVEINLQSSLIETLKNNGHEVVHELKDKDIDIIFIIDPRIRNPNVSFSTGAILRYLFLKITILSFCIELMNVMKEKILKQ